MNTACQRRKAILTPGSGDVPGPGALSVGIVPGPAAKRLYDLCLSFLGLLLLSPLFALVACFVKIAGGGDVLYRQVRIGIGGREFQIYKFRTMIAAADLSGPSITKNGDARITWFGRVLRRTKFDELPQLWNVFKGEMSLVGPRPEVPRYVRHYTPQQRKILQHKPGITDLASLCFRDEEALLASADNLEEFYIRHCIPRKLELNREYAERASLLSDTWIIIRTICPYPVGVLACYGIILAISYLLSCELVSNFGPLESSGINLGRELCIVLPLQLAALTWRKQSCGLLSYFSFPELRHIGAAFGLVAVGLLAWSAAGRGHPAPNLILIDAVLSFCLLGGFRVLLRHCRERWAEAAEATGTSMSRVGIIGAGRTGARLALELGGNRKLGRSVVAFFDDDSHKWQKRIHDVPVIGMPECLVDGWTGKLDEVVIAMPDAPHDRVREIENLLAKTSIRYYRASRLARFWEQQRA